MADGAPGPGGRPRRQRRPTGNLYPYLRWSAFGYGAIAAFVAYGSWSYDEPPVWSFAAPKAEAMVTSTTVEDAVDGEGKTRTYPRVEVRRLGSGDEPVLLRGVIPTFYAGTPEEARAIAGAYPAGAAIRVRIIKGAVFADRTDGADLFHAIFMSLAALVIVSVGFMIRRPEGDPDSRPPLIRDSA